MRTGAKAGQAVAAVLAAAGGVEGVDVDELGGGDVGVAEAGADLFDVPAGSDQRAGMGVAEGMEGWRGLHDDAVGDDGLRCSPLHRPAQYASGDVAVVVPGAGASREHEVMRRAARRGELLLAQRGDERGGDLQTRRLRPVFSATR